MELFKQLFISKKVLPEPATILKETYSAAGFVFTNGKVMLAGYQPYKRRPTITGLGGMRESYEGSFETALRETLEELLGYQLLARRQIEPILKRFPPKIRQENGDYTFYVYSFEDLERLLKLAKQYLKVAPVYTTFPKTLEDLLLKRNLLSSYDIEYKPEVKHLCILPVVKNANGKLFIDEALVRDMDILNKI